MHRISQFLNRSTVAAAVLRALGAGASAEPLKLVICHVDDRSGSAADTGIESLNGLKLVIDPIKADGGIDGQKIEMII